MKILLLEPFFSGSHQQWAEGLQRHSSHDFQILSLPGRHWKWRMYGGAVTLAAQFNQLDDLPDLILATDMLDLPTFMALTRDKIHKIPVALYFHENQITYPWSPTDADVPLKRNNQYGFINYTSALVADKVFFNSNYHKAVFLESLPAFLNQFPDHKGLKNVEKIQTKSRVLPLGMDLQRFMPFQQQAASIIPVLLWNHRWEYDKNPVLFFETLFKLKAEGLKFKLIVVGESYKKSPPVFNEAKNILAEEIRHIGYAPDFATYAKLLWQADILPVTSQQDFFGGSVVEAIYCGCYPILPKRLAYPEHLPVGMHPSHFYEHDHDFYNRLKLAVANKTFTSGFEGKNVVEKYDWKMAINTYDEALAELLTK